MEDWYKITEADFYRQGVPHLLRLYDNAAGVVMNFLTANIYDYNNEHEWIPWKFYRVSDTLWRDPEVQQRFMRYPYFYLLKLCVSEGPD